MKYPLGQAGSEEGVPYVYHWSIFKTFMRVFPLLLPLLCLTLPWNRNRKALLLLVPYGLEIALVVGVMAFAAASPVNAKQDAIVYIGIIVSVLGLLWAVTWSLMPWLGRLWPGAAVVVFVLLFAVGGTAALFVLFLEPSALKMATMLLGGYATSLIGLTALIRLFCLRGKGRRFRIIYMALAHVPIGMAFSRPLHHIAVQMFYANYTLVYSSGSLCIGVAAFFCLWPYLLLARFSEWHRAHLDALLRWRVSARN